VIPRANITAWQATAPWATDAQGLVLSRATIEIFSDPELLTRALAIRISEVSIAALLRERR
jgi:hypothetical protein